MLPIRTHCARVAMTALCVVAVAGCASDAPSRSTPIAESGLRTIDVYAYGLE